MKISFEAKYKVGQKIKMADREYTCIGFDYVPQRALRYILAHSVDGQIKWEYFFDFEIEYFIG